MGKLLGVVFVAIDIFIIAPAVGAGIALGLGMTIVVGILALLAIVCFA